jgi:hypothetical protein
MSKVPLFVRKVPIDCPVLVAYWKSACDVVALQSTAWKLVTACRHGEKHATLLAHEEDEDEDGRQKYHEGAHTNMTRET